jgi:ribokinase
VGSFNTDLLVRTPRIPAPGETILGGPFYTGPGGKGANQAVAAARLGAEVTAVIKLGKDYYGDLALDNLKKEGIQTGSVIRTDETHTGVAFIIVDDSGENVIVVASGSNYELTPQDIDGARDAITTADMLVMQLEIPMETVKHAARIAAEAGVKVLLNPAPGQALDADLLEVVDFLTPNETEAQLISGVAASGVEQAEQAARQMLNAGTKTVIVTLGGQGALIVSGEQVQHVAGRKVEVVDTTGAGDAFNGALAVAVAEGKDLAAAVEFANCAAALQVTKVGTAPAMPYRDEVEKLLTGVRA